MKRLRGAVLACVMALAAVVAFPAAAQAHYVYQQGVLATYGQYCTVGRAEVSHGSGGGYTKTDTDSETEQIYTGVQCIQPFARAAGNLAAKYDYYYWRGGEWVICRLVGDYYYNSSNAAKFVMSYNFGVRPPCGDGYYGTMSYTYVNDGTTWRGGAIWSGYQYIPAQ